MRWWRVSDPVVIEHDNVHAQLPRAVHGLMVLAAAVDGDHQARASGREVLDPQRA